MNRTILLLLLLSVVLADSIPCIEQDLSSLAQASDCSVSRLDSTSISWGVKITFTGDATHREDNWLNLLADLEHPRFPYWPVGGKCDTAYGKYTSGQSILVNCTQEFEDIPVGYVNSVVLLEDSLSPLAVAMKIPLSQERTNLKMEE